MKISNYMNNANLIVEKNATKAKKEDSQTNEKHTMEQSAKLSISNEAMECYRNRIQQNGQETYDEVLQRRELLKSGKIKDIDYGYEISKKAAELNKDAANAGQNALGGPVFVKSCLALDIFSGRDGGERAAGRGGGKADWLACA